jgi:hypothetical protein
MSDPILFFHRVQGTRDVYDTSSVQFPGSIRDQIMRGQWIIDRAFEDRRIGVDKDLLVVGAGAGGVSAALRAISLGVNTYLLDAADGPFSRQISCSTRIIDPSVYEWPLEHHSELRWGDSPRMMLAYGPSPADQVVKAWLPLVMDSKHLRTLWRHVVREIPKPRDGVLTVLAHPLANGNPIVISVGAALWAAGAGDENTRCGRYRGFRFWEIDPYGQESLGVSGEHRRAVISGGGDGALQDLFRLAFKPSSMTSPRDLLKFVAHLDAKDQDALALAEDQAQRTLIWNGGPREAEHDHPVLVRLHNEHARIAEKYAGERHVRDTILSSLREPFPTLCFVHPCSHFSRCYALNRFVGLLLLQVLEKEKLVDYQPRCGVAEVVASVRGGGPNHVCSDPVACHGQDHDVAVASRSCGTAPSALRRLGTFNIIVLRHGIERLKMPTFSLNARRQLLPYELS